jgi:gas vesicle protein
MKSGQVMLGILVGAAAGALLGVLFAPEKGEVIRGKISKKGEDYAQTLKDKFDEFLDSVTGKFHSAKAEAADMADQGRVKAEELKKDAKNAMG